MLSGSLQELQQMTLDMEDGSFSEKGLDPPGTRHLFVAILYLGPIR